MNDNKNLIQTFYRTENFQFLQLTEFPIENSMVDEQIISKFIQQDSFPILTNLPRVDRNTAMEMNGIPFDNSNFKYSDFQIFSVQEILDFTIQFTNEYSDENWIMNDSYKNLHEQLKEIVTSISTDRIYFANVDSFKKDGIEKLRQNQAECYTYYFLMLWVDREVDKLIICEWGND